MVDINWGLLGGNNALSMFQVGNQLGAQIRERQDEKRSRNALMQIGGFGQPPGGLVATPQQQATTQALEQRAGALSPWADLSREDLGTAMRLQGQQAQMARQQQEQRRADLPLLTRLVETATDEASYQRNRAVAQEYGIDTANLPPQFDPAWRDQQLSTLKALQDPAKTQALSAAGKIAIDMGLKPGTQEFEQTVREIWTSGEAKPYVVGGETRLYTPKIGGGGQVQGGPAVGAVEDGYRFKGGNPADPGAWEPVGQGGGGARVTSGFLDGL